MSSESTITFPGCCPSNVTTIQYGKNGIHDQGAGRAVRQKLSNSESIQVKRKFEEQRLPRKVSIPTITSLRLANEQYSSSNGKAYVLKYTFPANWEQAKSISRDLRGSRFVRLPVDFIKDELILVYPYFTQDLMSFLNDHQIPIAQTKGILFSVLKGLKEMHDHNWVHTGMNQAFLSARALCDR